MKPGLGGRKWKREKRQKGEQVNRHYISWGDFNIIIRNL